MWFDSEFFFFGSTIMDTTNEKSNGDEEFRPVVLPLTSPQDGLIKGKQKIFFF